MTIEYTKFLVRLAKIKHKKLKFISAKTQKPVNALIVEAIDKLIYKYQKLLEKYEGKGIFENDD